MLRKDECPFEKGTWVKVLGSSKAHYPLNPRPLAGGFSHCLTPGSSCDAATLNPSVVQVANGNQMIPTDQPHGEMALLNTGRAIPSKEYEGLKQAYM